MDKSVSARCLLIAASITIVLALPIIIMGSWLSLRHHINCIRFLEIPILFIGLALVLVSLVGIVGVLRHQMVLVSAYLVLSLLLLVLLLAFVLFMFIVTSGSGAHSVPAANFFEYNLGEYSTWLQDQVTDTFQWASLSVCLRDQRICTGLNRQYSTLLDFNTAYLSPVESGCCKPPNACGYTFVTPTQWVTAINPSSTSDCAIWSNTGLCYDCNTCKAGLLEMVRRDWSKVAEVSVTVLILLTILYLASWLAFLKGLQEGYFKRATP